MTFDHHTQLIRATSRVAGSQLGLRLRAAHRGTRVLLGHVSHSIGMQLSASVCKQSRLESTSLHNQILCGKSGAGVGGRPFVRCSAASQRNKQKGRSAKMPENPHILRCSHFACNARNLLNDFVVVCENCENEFVKMRS